MISILLVILTLGAVFYKNAGLGLHFVDMTTILLIGALVLFIALLWQIQRNRGSPYDALDLVMDQGRASLDKHITLIMAGLAIWWIVSQTLDGKDVSERMIDVLMIFVIYRGAKEAINAYSKRPLGVPPTQEIEQQVVVTPNAPPIPPAPEVRPVKPRKQAGMISLVMLGIIAAVVLAGVGAFAWQMRSAGKAAGIAQEQPKTQAAILRAENAEARVRLLNSSLSEAIETNRRNFVEFEILSTTLEKSQDRLREIESQQKLQQQRTRAALASFEESEKRQANEISRLRKIAETPTGSASEADTILRNAVRDLSLR